jgi:ADP-ribose pyrophosphatase YjhB (NUDIX family)
MTRAYTYCPFCAAVLEERSIEGKLRKVCPVCSFIQFADPKVAVVALVEHDGRVLLARRAVEPARGAWALPGGYMDAGEMPVSAVRREVLEEVSLTIEVHELLDIFPMVNSGGASLGIVLAFRATPRQSAEPTVISQDDVDEAGWFRPDELPTPLAFDSTRTLLAAWCARTVDSSAPGTGVA